MFNKSFVGVVCASLTVVTFSANAALISVDLNSVGDGLITRDTVTGLEWLDLTETLNMSYNNVTAELGTGGLFAGWSYARPEEVTGLFDSAGGTGPYTGWSTVNNGIVIPLLSLWGDTTGNMEAHFLIDEVPSLFSHQQGFIGDNPAHSLSLTQDFMGESVASVGDASTSVVLGSALVRASVVPVPAAVWLFGSGLIGLIGVARRKVRT